MEVYAGYYEFIDDQIGRIIDAIDETGELDNTLIIYIAGDNGASAEGGMAGTGSAVAMLNGIDFPIEDLQTVISKKADETRSDFRLLGTRKYMPTEEDVLEVLRTATLMLAFEPEHEEAAKLIVASAVLLDAVGL